MPDEAGGEPTVVIYLTLVPNRMQMRLSPRTEAGDSPPGSPPRAATSPAKMNELEHTSLS